MVQCFVTMDIDPPFPLPSGNTRASIIHTAAALGVQSNVILENDLVL